ncbi:ABATE domain-containing protein [Kocuria palustris]|uniref:ABATE domain-containing protein n=1 Tax=Kocuria palustris TaxID=71999 RepID=UPI00119ED722|nr:ABATE domain-containing protein [Kocuria palustris]
MSPIPLPPAPGAADHIALALADSRVTLPGDQVADELDSPEAATAWLRQRELVPADTALLSYCQHQLTGLRAELRELLVAQAEGRAPSARALRAVNSALTAAPAAATLGHDPGRGYHRALEHPVTRQVEFAMARIAEDAVALLTGEAREQIDRCDATPCDRLYLRTHARRHWCSTRCGDRVRAARAYARKHGRAVGA